MLLMYGNEITEGCMALCSHSLCKYLLCVLVLLLLTIVFLSLQAHHTMTTYGRSPTPTLTPSSSASTSADQRHWTVC